MNSKPDKLLLGAVCLAITAALLIYSQTEAFAWDEGFHLLAARLILAGKRPYADFLFAQTPLNAFWNALIMRVTGVGWRVPQMAAALETAGAVWLIASYILMRSRLSVAIAVAVLIGLNDVVVWYGCIPQAYGLCMLLGSVAFRFCIGGRALWAGLAAGAAASASLLAAPLGPVLFVWISIRSRMRQSLAFVAGSVVGLSPVLWALATAAHRFIFDVVGFHVYYRQVQWSGWVSHDAGVMTAWLDSGTGLILIGLALAGAWVGRARDDIRLCSWVAGVAAAYLATAHPTFPQYFTAAIPFAAVLASAALDKVDGRWPAVVIPALMVAALSREIWQEHTDFSWATLAPVIQKVKEVTTPGARVLADEHIYLMSGIIPPEGLEWSAGHKIEMPMDRARPFHVLPQSELDKQIRNRLFDVLETCEESDVKRLILKPLYKNMEPIGDDCFVFWNPNRP